MRTRRLSGLFWLAAVFTLASLAACSGPKKPAVSNAIFYPPSPDPPKLQFLVGFDDAEIWLKKRSSFSDFIVGSEKERRGFIKRPYGLAVRKGKIYVCDVGRHLIHVIDVARRKYSILGTPDQIQQPVNITIDTDGTKYVCDTRKRMVAVFDARDKFLRYMGDPQTCVPFDLAISGDNLFVVDVKQAQIEVWSKDGQFLRAISSKGEGPDQLRRPTCLQIGPQGHIFVTDQELATVKVFDQKGNFLKTIGQQGDRLGDFFRPKGIAIDAQGQMYVADAHWQFVQVFSASDDQLLLVFGGPAQTKERLDGMGIPAALAIDRTSLNAFSHLLSKDFQAQYLLFLANQYGKNKISIYAFGHQK